MMVSTRGRYALRLMIDIAEQKGEGNLTLRSVAERQNISEKYLETIVKQLVSSGMLSATRGKGGGYRMTRTPEEYTVAEILNITEGSIAPVACLENGEVECERSEMCRTVSLWKGLDKVVNDYLSGITVADLMRPELPNNECPCK